MQNGNGNTAVIEPDLRPARARAKMRNSKLLYQMIGVAALFHLIIVLCTGKSSDEASPEQLFEKGELAMASGHYLEALDHYQRVLEMQPKLPPVFEKAAEQHRNADRLAKAQAAKLATTQDTAKTAESGASGTPASRPSTAIPVKTVPATKPEFEVPPELRVK